MQVARASFLLVLTLFIALAPVVPSYGCRCEATCAAPAESIARGARQDFCACCTPELPERTDGDPAPRRSREICTCRKPAPQAHESSADPVPAPAVQATVPTLASFAAASRAVSTVTHETASNTPPLVEVRLRV